jgi:DNA-binding FadR family transcriptional regulator
MPQQPIKIRPITEQNLTDRVERRILEDLNEKEFRPGETLPTELEFAEAIGVSRNVVREAFIRL